VKNLDSYSVTKPLCTIMKICQLICRSSIWCPMVVLYISQRCLPRFALLHLGSPCFPSLCCWNLSNATATENREGTVVVQQQLTFPCTAVCLYRWSFLSNEFIPTGLTVWSLIFPVFLKVVSDGQWSPCSTSARHGDGKEGGRGCATANMTRIRL
jgi:hypothetical protein